MKKIFAVFSLLVLLITFISVNSTKAANGWTETQPAGDTDSGWVVSGMSDDGQTIAIAANGGRLYVSSNGGDTWAERQPGGAVDQNWRTLCVSGDGSTVIAGIDGGRLYYSSLGGSVFTEAQPLGDTTSRWRSCAISDDGQTIWVGTDRSGGFLTTDGASSWNPADPPAVGDDGVYFTASMSSDGQIILVGTYDEQTLYLSTDGGGTWNATNASVTDDAWNASAMSDNGQIIIAAQEFNRVYLSTNGGSDWSEVQPDGDNDRWWNWLSMTDNGATILAASNVGLFFSENTGSAWFETNPVDTEEYNWGTVAVNSDATNNLAAVNGGRVWLAGDLQPVGTPTPTPTPAPSSSTSNGGGSSTSQANPPSCTSEKPQGVPDLFQIDTAKNSATLYFAPVNNASNYAVSYGMNDSIQQYGTQVNMGNSTGVLSLTINGLNPNTQYSFAISAQNGCAIGSTSNAMKIQTGVSKKYYKNFATQIVNTVLPPKATALGVATEKIPVQTKVQNVPQKPAVKTSSNSLTKPSNSAPKPQAAQKSCFLFFCW